MTAHSTPSSAETAPEALLRGWAKAYRDTPEHRFPSDPDAEFFPVDLEYAASELERAQKRIEELTDALKFYRDEWNTNGDGDSETPGLSRTWQEPTDELITDAGRKAHAALTAGAR